MARARSTKAVLALPDLSPAAVRVLRRRLPEIIEAASASIALAATVAGRDPEGALYHLMLAAEAASRAQALASPRRR